MYIKKPIEVEAFQLNSRGLVAEDWFWDAVSKNDIVTHFFGKNESCDAWCQIKTLEGVMSAFTGDYIIRGINGEIYPCKADIFEKTYSKVGTADVAEVVRCKDCKHATFYSCKNDSCYKGIICEYRIGTDDENFYCSYGERRTDDGNL